MSGAHSRAAKNIRWNAVRPVSYCGCFSAGFAAGCAAGVAGLFSEEHETSSANAQHKNIVLIMDFVPRARVGMLLLYSMRREDLRPPFAGYGATGIGIGLPCFTLSYTLTYSFAAAVHE